MLEIKLVIYVSTVWTFEKTGECGSDFNSFCYGNFDLSRVRGFISSNCYTSINPITFFITKLTQWYPILALEIIGKTFYGMFFTGTEVSVISLQH